MDVDSSWLYFHVLRCFIIFIRNVAHVISYRFYGDE